MALSNANNNVASKSKKTKKKKKPDPPLMKKREKPPSPSSLDIDTTNNVVQKRAKENKELVGVFFREIMKMRRRNKDNTRSFSFWAISGTRRGCKITRVPY